MTRNGGGGGGSVTSAPSFQRLHNHALVAVATGFPIGRLLVWRARRHILSAKLAERKVGCWSKFVAAATRSRSRRCFLLKAHEICSTNLFVSRAYHLSPFADACQRVPSIAATTIQPELSLTAKWPSADAARGQLADQSSGRFNLRQPARVAFDEGQYRPQPAEAPSSSSSDDMSGSESSQQPAQQSPPQQMQPTQQRQQLVPAQQHRRSQPNQSGLPQIDGRIPQFLLPTNTRRLAGVHGARLQPQQPPASTETLSTTAAPTTTTTTEVAATTAEQSEPNRGAEPASEETPGDSANESESLTRLGGPSPAKEQPAAQDVAPQSSESAASGSEQVDKQPQRSPAAAAAAASEQPAQANEQQVAPSPSSAANEPADQSAEASENKPSVQGTDDEQTPPAAKSDAPSADKSSSLKTVEIEIPANEDPVRALMNNQQALDAGAKPAQVNSFQSVRLSNENNRAPLSYGSRDLYGESTRTATAVDQIIQPREKQRNGAAEEHVADELAGLEAASQLLGSGRVKFGARSQPSQAQQQQAAQEAAAVSEQQQHANHQPVESSSLDQTNLRASDSSSLVNPVDRVLIDRSDDSSIAESSSSSEQTSNAGAGKDASLPSDMAGEESSISSAKVRPVVGTDELATGPVRIEDRIGSPAQSDSLEETLNRLQHQIPRAAALVSSAAAPSQQQQQASQAAGDSTQVVAADDEDLGSRRDATA